MYIGNGAIIQIHLKDKQQFHRKSQTKQQRCDAKNTFNFVPQTRADDASVIRVRGCTVDLSHTMCTIKFFDAPFLSYSTRTVNMGYR